MKKPSAKIGFMLIILGVSILIGIILTLYFDGTQSLNSLKDIGRNFIHSIILGGALWFGNLKIANYCNRKNYWIKPNKLGIVIHVCLAFTYSLTVMFLFYSYIWFLRMGNLISIIFSTILNYSFYIFSLRSEHKKNQQKMPSKAVTLHISL
jgi:hypothetical protein